MTKRLISLAFTGLLLATRAFAQSVGSIDPGTSLQSILTWGLGLAGVVIALICIFQGIKAVADGRHIGSVLIGLVVGVAICFGGAAIVSHFGVGAGSAVGL